MLFLQNGQRLLLKSMNRIGVQTTMGRTDHSQLCSPAVFNPRCSGRYLKYQFAQPVATTMIQPTARNSLRRRPKDSAIVIRGKSMPMPVGMRCGDSPGGLPGGVSGEGVTFKPQPTLKLDQGRAPGADYRKESGRCGPRTSASRTGDRRHHPGPEEYSHDRSAAHRWRLSKRALRGGGVADSQARPASPKGTRNAAHWRRAP
jgi:hypothetical protein